MHESESNDSLWWEGAQVTPDGTPGGMFFTGLMFWCGFFHDLIYVLYSIYCTNSYNTARKWCYWYETEMCTPYVIDFYSIVRLAGIIREADLRSIHFDYVYRRAIACTITDGGGQTF